MANRLIERDPILLAKAVPFVFGIAQGLQALVQFAFENIGDEPVSGIHFHEAALRQLGGLAAPLYGLLAQNGNFIVPRLHFCLYAQCDLQRDGRNEAEKKLADCLVNVTFGHGLAMWRAVLSCPGIARVTYMRASLSPVTLYDQVSAADPAQGDTKEQGGPFSSCAL